MDLQVRGVVAALFALQACAGSPLATPARRAAPAANEADTCRLDRDPPSGSLAIEVSGVIRDFELELPRDYDGRKRFPVLFAWHGTSSSGLEFMHETYGRIVGAVAGRALIVAPDGLIEEEGEWAGMTRWQLSNADGALFDLLLDKLIREYCIDPKRVFSVGHSIGAYFTHYLGCTRGERLRGIAAIAGGGPLDTSECVGHPAVLIGHNPAECAEPAPPHCPFAVPWADTGWESAKFWASRNGCEEPAPPPAEAYDGEQPCRPLAGCNPNSPVSLCLYDFETVFAGPHAWPTPWMSDAIVNTFLALPSE